MFQFSSNGLDAQEGKCRLIALDRKTHGPATAHEFVVLALQLSTFAWPMTIPCNERWS